MENSSQISWLVLCGSTYGDVFIGQTCEQSMLSVSGGWWIQPVCRDTVCLRIRHVTAETLNNVL